MVFRPNIPKYPQIDTYAHDELLQMVALAPTAPIFDRLYDKPSDPIDPRVAVWARDDVQEQAWTLLAGECSSPPLWWKDALSLFALYFMKGDGIHKLSVNSMTFVHDKNHCIYNLYDL